MTRREYPWLGTKPGPAPEFRYGRGPSSQVLSDVREMTMVHERMLAFGPILPGQTLYRTKLPGGWAWQPLPDPEKPALAPAADDPHDRYISLRSYRGRAK